MVYNGLRKRRGEKVVITVLVEKSEYIYGKAKENGKQSLNDDI